MAGEVNIDQGYDYAAEYLAAQSKKVKPPFEIVVEVPFTEELAPLFDSGKAKTMSQNDEPNWREYLAKYGGHKKVNGERKPDVIVTVGPNDFIPKDAHLDTHGNSSLKRLLLIDGGFNGGQDDGESQEAYGRWSAHSGDIVINCKPTNWGGNDSEDKLTVEFPDGRTLSCVSYDRNGYVWPAVTLVDIANEIREHKKRNIPIDKRTTKNNPGLAQKIYKKFADKFK